MDQLGTARCGLLVARGLVPTLTLATPLRQVVLIVPIVHLHSSHDWISMVLIPLDAQLVVDIPDAGDGLQDVLGESLRLPALDGPREGHFAVLDADLNAGGVEHAVMG